VGYFILSHPVQLLLRNKRGEPQKVSRYWFLQK